MIPMRSFWKPLHVKKMRPPPWQAGGRGSWVLVFLVFLFAASPAFADDEARRIVALLDYLGTDYKNAVRDGKIVRQDEYQEMREFSARTLELFNQLKEID